MPREWIFEDALPVIGSITEGNAWDGSRLLFANGLDPSSVWVMDADGTNAAELVADTSQNPDPVWSLDGSFVINEGLRRARQSRMPSSTQTTSRKWSVT